MRRKSIFSATADLDDTSPAWVLSNPMMIAIGTFGFGEISRKDYFPMGSERLPEASPPCTREHTRNPFFAAMTGCLTVVVQLSDILSRILALLYRILVQCDRSGGRGAPFIFHFVLYIMQYYINNQPRHRMLATNMQVSQHTLGS